MDEATLGERIACDPRRKNHVAFDTARSPLCKCLSGAAFPQWNHQKWVCWRRRFTESKIWPKLLCFWGVSSPAHSKNSPGKSAIAFLNALEMLGHTSLEFKGNPPTHWRLFLFQLMAHWNMRNESIKTDKLTKNLAISLLLIDLLRKSMKAKYSGFSVQMALVKLRRCACSAGCPADFWRSTIAGFDIYKEAVKK